MAAVQQVGGDYSVKMKKGIIYTIIFYIYNIIILRTY